MLRASHQNPLVKWLLLRRRLPYPSLAMTSPDHFQLGVSLVDPAAPLIELEFQQELYQEDRITIRAPRGLFEELGVVGFAEHVADYYLQEHPTEAERVGRDTVVQAVKDAIAWGRADSRHPQGLL